MPMPMSERARLGGLATAAQYRTRRDRFLAAVSAGEPVKRAAFAAGIAERTARRYRAEAR